MINLKKNILLLKAAAITGCFLIYGCSNNYQEIQDLAKKRVPVDTAINIQSYLSQDGVVKAKLTAPIMTTTTLSDTPQTEFPKSVHVEFYNDSIKIQSVLSAKYALYYTNKRLVLMKNDVVVYNISGDTLRTQKLWWDQDKQLIYTDVPVHIIQQNEPLEGQNGMTANQDFSAWTLLKAKGTLPVADSTLPN